MLRKVVTSVKLAMEKLEHFLELGGTKKDITLLVISGIALIVSIFDLVPLPFDASWAAIILCGIPIILEAAIGKATKHGFLVREGDALERLAAVKKISFDKTGTLTYGTPKVVLVHSALPSLSDNEFYRLCATAERYSEYPLGKAITRCCQQETGEALGSDIAVDAADIALVDDEVKELPHLIALSKRMMRTIKLNITFSLTLNFIAIVLAITGTLSPVVGALVHNAGSVLVITNSALLLKWRQTASQSFASADAKSV